jgi:hypothetical protein
VAGGVEVQRWAEFAQKAPWLVIFLGTAISLVVFASNLLGDALRDTLDLRLGRERSSQISFRESLCAPWFSPASMP